MFKLRHRVWFSGLLPLLLVLAQQLAIAHLASHSGDSVAGSDKTLVHSKLCGKCVAIEKLSHTPPAAAQQLVLAEASHVTIATQQASSPQTDSGRQPCRDPPHIL